jgi:hypothetical protein
LRSVCGVEDEFLGIELEQPLAHAGEDFDVFDLYFGVFERFTVELVKFGDLCRFELCNHGPVV